MANANAGTFFAHLKTFGVRLEESTRALRDALNTSTTADLAVHPAVSRISATDVVNELVTDVSAVDKRVTAMETHAIKQHDAGLDQ
eukprot:7241-Heterococcus_DN1.PRE.2